ncbi:restriction endonuclease subunit S [Micromonospora sp. NPDC051543]|uniref:restriction endonuclease subunit S n=1 Tax=Micromonospora sp. NPDC051543 TaxID=3364287 RepID=UPI00378F6037
MRWYGEGVFHRETVNGNELSAAYVSPLVPAAFIYNRLFAWKASFAVVPESLASCYVSNEFPQFVVDEQRILPEYLYLFFTRESTVRAVNAASTGSAAVSRNRFKEDDFLDFELPLPPLEWQSAVVTRWREALDSVAAMKKGAEETESAIESRFLADVGLRTTREVPTPKAFAAPWRDVERWGAQMVLLRSLGVSASSFPEVPLIELCQIGSGGTPSRRRPDYFGGDIPWVKTTEVRNEVIVATEEALTDLGVKNSSAKVYPAGSIVIAMYGQGATRGRSAKLGIEAATNQACAVLFDLDDRVDADFLWYFLMSQYEPMRSMASGNNQPNLNARMIAGLRIPVPPMNEQKEIAARFAAGRAEIAQQLKSARETAAEMTSVIDGLVFGSKS